MAACGKGGPARHASGQAHGCATWKVSLNWRMLLRSQNAQDQKRAKVWGTIAKKIVQAAKAGGPDVVANQRLAEVIKAAKAAEVGRLATLPKPAHSWRSS